MNEITHNIEIKLVKLILPSSYIHNLNNPYECNLCIFRCFEEFDLTNHVNVAHSKTKTNKLTDANHQQLLFKCEECGLDFDSNYSFASHMLFESTETPMETELQNELQLIASLQTAVKSFDCELCQKQFATKTILKNHLKAHHPAKAKEKIVKCPFCPNSYFTESQMKFHVRTHTGEKPIRRMSCEFSPTLARTLIPDRDLMIDARTGEKPFKCDKCNKQFGRKPHLQMHMKVHQSMLMKEETEF